MKRTYIILLIILFCTNGCISEYHPTGMETFRGILVVNGTITEGETRVKLSKSVAINELFTDSMYITDATVSVECNDGTFYTSINQDEEGLYYITVPQLKPDLKYRLNVEYKNERFTSDFLSPLFAPEIENIRWEHDPIKKVVNIYTATDKITSNESRYYRWSFDETWEYKAELFAEAAFFEVDGQTVFLETSLNTSLNTYNCWSYSKSSGLVLASSEKNEENIAVTKIIEIPTSSDKLSVMYHIKTYLYSIRQEAYDYFNNLQKNVDELGSIFAPVPSEMVGNIVCETNPNIAVIGYVDVSTVTTKEMYISREEAVYEPPLRLCSQDVRMYKPPGFLFYYSVPFVGTYYALDRCLDCRVLGGTKDKPDNWPTPNL